MIYNTKLLNAFLRLFDNERMLTDHAVVVVFGVVVVDDRVVVEVFVDCVVVGDNVVDT